MTELRDNYEKAQRKLETADANLKRLVYLFNKKEL
jgi:hypothetical protein